MNTTVNWIKVNTVTDDMDKTVTSNNFGGGKKQVIPDWSNVYLVFPLPSDEH